MHRRDFLKLGVLAGTSVAWPTRFVSEDFANKQINETSLKLRSLTKGRADLWKYKGLAYIKDGPVAYAPGIEQLHITEIDEGYFEKLIFEFKYIEALQSFTVYKFGLMDERGQIIGTCFPENCGDIEMCKGDELHITYTLSV